MATASSGRDAWDEQKGKPSSRAAWRPDGSAVLGQQRPLQHVCSKHPKGSPKGPGTPQGRPKNTPRARPAVAHPVFPGHDVFAASWASRLPVAGQCAQSPRLGPRVSQDCAAPRGLGVIWAGRDVHGAASTDSSAADPIHSTCPASILWLPSAQQLGLRGRFGGQLASRIFYIPYSVLYIIPQRRRDLCEAIDSIL